MIILSAKLRNRFNDGEAFQLRNIIINGDKRGCSGFITLGDNVVYVNTERCGTLGYMYRIAKHTKDYSGGVNQWARDLDNLVVGVKRLLSV